MGKFWRGVVNAWNNRRDADFTDLSWQGWDDQRSQAVETDKQNCHDAVFLLTQQGYYIVGVNRSARLLHISTPGRIALDVAEPYNSSVPRKGFLQR